ncbi:MAG: ATP-grasp domain-containing protein [Candidatus Gracilibacteria bacterium]|nr:ATP-grasp domain-containing protein [Candidatus Gracilibacteria bacterium]
MGKMMDYFSITSKILVSEAKKLGFFVEILNEKKNFFLIKGNGKEVYFKNNDFGGNSALGYKIADDKELTNLILDKNGVKVPKSIYLKKSEFDSFDVTSINLSFPLVTKPVDEGHGNGVTVGIDSLDELNYGIKEAFRFSDNIIIQEHIEGDEHRILVIGDKIVLGIKRIPAFIIGDGIHNIKELIEIENKNPLRGIGYESILCIIKTDDRLMHYIGKNGYNLYSVPKKRENIQLVGISNLGAGGVLKNVTNDLGEELKQECLKAAKILGLKVVGVDVVTKDLSKSLIETNGAIIEVNTTPGFGGDFELAGVNTGLELLKHVFNI